MGNHGNELDCQQALGRFQHERAVVLDSEPRPGELEEDGARPLQQELVRVTVAQHGREDLEAAPQIQAPPRDDP